MTQKLKFQYFQYKMAQEPAYLYTGILSPKLRIAHAPKVKVYRRLFFLQPGYSCSLPQFTSWTDLDPGGDPVPRLLWIFHQPRGPPSVPSPLLPFSKMAALLCSNRIILFKSAGRFRDAEGGRNFHGCDNKQTRQPQTSATRKRGLGPAPFTNVSAFS